MALRMMTSSERAGLPNVETVHDYPGAETKYIVHHWDCPHYKNPDPKIRSFATERLPDCHPACKHHEGLYMETTFEGCVISLRERNGSDDSDFFALVWDDAKGTAYEVEYATTRGWTYPNGATVDATPEVLAKYAAWKREVFFKLAKSNDAEASKTPSRGKVCTVVAGRKIAKGTTVEVLRVYTDSYMGRKTEKAVVKFMLEGSYTQVHTATSNLEVVNPDLYLTPDAKLRERAYNSADANNGLCLFTR